VAGLFPRYALETIDGLEIFWRRLALERIHGLLSEVVCVALGRRWRSIYAPIQTGTILRGERFPLSAFPVFHRGPDVSFLLEEKLAGRSCRAADALEIPPGPGGVTW